MPVFAAVAEEAAAVAVSVLLSVDAVGRAESLDKSVEVESVELLPEPSVNDVGDERSLDSTAVAVSLDDTEANILSLETPLPDVDADVAEGAEVINAVAKPETSEAEANAGTDVADADESDKRLNASCTLIVVVLFRLAESVVMEDGDD